MSYKIIPTKVFEKELKALFKKYRSLKDDLNLLKLDLLENPKTGIHLGKDVYKIRLAIKSKGKGKSGGARVITHFKVTKETIYLLSIYDKSQESSISENQIIELIKQIL